MISAEIKLPELANECKAIVDCQQVMQWPEAIAFFTRLGIKLDRPYSRLIVDLNFAQGGWFPRVLMDQYGRDAEGGDK